MFRLFSKDVLGLLEAMSKYSLFIYNEYSLNITKYKTLPGLSLAIYFIWFYKENNPIKMIKGPLEKIYQKCLFWR